MKLERKWRRRALVLLALALLLLLAASLVPEITIGGYIAISVTNWRIRMALAAAALVTGVGGWLLLRRHWCCPHCGAGVKLWARRGGECRCERCGRLLRFDDEPEEPEEDEI